jgi:hypothetical protein
MSDSASIAGRLGQRDHPNWEPLLGLIGEELVGEFMWMAQIDLADGTVVHAYKHILTRCYLHVQEGGRTLAFTASGRYRPIDPYHAIADAFDGWRGDMDETTEVEVLRAALRQAYRKASAR